MARELKILQEELHLLVEGFTEIEFVCHNIDFKNSTTLRQQELLYNDLKEMEPDVVPYKQNFSDKKQCQISLAVIITNKNDERKLISKIKNIARRHKVEIDIIDNVSDKKLDDVITGKLENLV